MSIKNVVEYVCFSINYAATFGFANWLLGRDKIEGTGKEVSQVMAHYDKYCWNEECSLALDKLIYTEDADGWWKVIVIPSMFVPGKATIVLKGTATYVIKSKTKVKYG